MYPPAFGVFLRKAATDLEIGGYDVPKGGLIALSSWVTQRDPRWYPNPLEFQPERFLPSKLDEVPSGAWFPLGMGPRACVGQSFALMEMALVVSRLLPGFQVSRPPGEPHPFPIVTASPRPRDRDMIRFQLIGPRSTT